jgi:hypothetical protein
VFALTRFAPALLCALVVARPFLRADTGLSGELETAVGYKDNLLLSHSDEKRSAFVRGRAEVFALHLSEKSPFDCSVFGEVNGTRYFSSVVVEGERIDHEAGAWLNVEPGYRLGDSLKLTLLLLGYYRDEVMDVSDTEVRRSIVAWKIWSGSVAPTLRWTFHRAWWLEASATGERTRYDDHSEDSRLGGGEVRLAWRPVARVEVRLTGRQRWRDFDSRVQYDLVGFPVADTRLKVAEREGELRLNLTWDKAEQWKTVTRANLMDYRDNGTGFFDYREKGVSQELEWKTDRWLARLEGRASRLDFDVQTTGLGFARPLLKDRYSAEIRLERMLSSRWAVFAGYTWERRRSNEEISSYMVNEGLLGLRWSWVK